MSVGLFHGSWELGFDSAPETFHADGNDENGI